MTTRSKTAETAAQAACPSCGRPAGDAREVTQEDMARKVCACGYVFESAPALKDEDDE